eukprot:2415899-Rhodomonas_salina.3
MRVAGARERVQTARVLHRSCRANRHQPPSWDDGCDRRVSVRWDSTARVEGEAQLILALDLTGTRR